MVCVHTLHDLDTIIILQMKYVTNNAYRQVPFACLKVSLENKINVLTISSSNESNTRS